MPAWTAPFHRFGITAGHHGLDFIQNTHNLNIILSVFSRLIDKEPSETGLLLLYRQQFDIVKPRKDSQPGGEFVNADDDA